MKPASLDGSRWRRLLAALWVALLAVSCGGGSERAGDAPALAEDAEAAAMARQLAEGNPQAAQAVAAAQALQAEPESESAQFLGFGRRIRQVVVFGDSLSDVGTYRVGDIEAVGGGKFTTNPGPVWSEAIGILFRARVTPFRVGFGGVSQVVGGSGFAMGGARVSQQPGIGCNPDAITGACTAQLSIPVTQQIGDYLSANGDQFNRGQVVFVFAGGNDILSQLEAVGRGVPPQEALGAVAQAALELAAAVGHIWAHGATRVAVLTVPDLADSIFGRAPEQAQVRPLIALMVQVFNGTLTAALAGTPTKIIDIHALFKDTIANPGRYGVVELNVPACDPVRIALVTGGRVLGGSSLFCSPFTLVDLFAPLTYLFADGVHPTTLGHLNIARFVLIEMWRQGLF